MRVSLDTAVIRWRIRRAAWLRLFFHFDPIAARAAAWCRRAARCMGCGVRLQADERKYYGHSCERCEGRNMAQWGDT